ncbi:MAG TPA: YdcH family protein [Vicinamibacterales bacterium]|nr:YdcH family protein [Vicinamibacterales bacterium]
MADAQLPVKDDVKSALLRTDEAFRQLVTEHQALDEKIRHLSSLSHLSDQQQYEETALKKQKLALKDRIEAIVRRQPPVSPPLAHH